MSDSARLLSNMCGIRYGEVFLAFLDGGQRFEVYDSFPFNVCPDDPWRALDPQAFAKENGATLAILNGPRHWLMDGVGKVANVEPRLRNVGGIDMRCVATLDLDGRMEKVYYAERQVNRGAMWHFDAGTTVHELTTPDTKTHIMQACCVGVDESLDEKSLVDLGAHLDLPDGWTYRSRVLGEESQVGTTHHMATVLQDELENPDTLVD